MSGLGERKHPELLYFRLVFYGVALDFPLNTLADALLPKEATHPTVGLLKEKLSATLIPFKLQTFKEKLPSKYGHLDFFVAPAENADEAHLKKHAEEIQKMVAHFVVEDLAPQVAVAVPGCKLHLVGNAAANFTPSGYSGFPLLKAFSASDIVSKSKDPLKAEVFLQTKIHFNVTEEGQTGALDLKQIAIPELAWLRTQLPEFPTNASSEDVFKYFESHFAGLNITVTAME